MRVPYRRHAILVLLSGIALLSAELARADWPSSPTVNLPVCVQTGQQLVATLATDMAGGVFITWYDQRNGVDYNIYAQHVLASGVVDPIWPSNGLAVCTAVGDQVLARTISDGAGGAVIAWQDRRGGTTADIYAHHVLSNALVDAAWPVNGRAVCTAPGDQTSPAIVSDGANGALLLWRDTQGDTDLVAGHVLANGQVDPTWPVNGSPFAVTTGSQNFPKVVGDGTGGLLAVWQDTRNGSAADVYAMRMRSDGNPASGWPANGAAVCTASGIQLLPSLSPDGAGGVFVGWEDQRSGTTGDAYVHHILANGVADPAWPADGRLVSVAAGNQSRALVQADAQGGAFVAWLDTRAGSIPAMYAQHVLANGTLDPAWPAADLGFNLMFGSHQLSFMMPDGTGGALVVWDDHRSGADVYAHHLLPGGSADPAWPANGRAVSTAINSQNVTGVIPDGSGGLIAVWLDQRTAANLNDIYAQRVQANGSLGGTVVDVPRTGSSTLALAPPTPTPSRDGRLGLRFTLPREGAASVELLDVAGRRVAARDLGTLPAGPHALDWLLDASVSPGVNWVRLRFGSETRTVRAVTLE